jgi:streptothricin acetyltransferase
VAIAIHAIGADRLVEYASIPMICDVQSIFAVEEIDGGLGGLALRECPVEVSYSKKYDAYPEGGPVNWPGRFDISGWGLWIATENGKVIGCAAAARNPLGANTRDGGDDVAVLWDIRVGESSQRHGVGTALFRNAVRWAKSKGCRLMKIETQNVNVAACRFYRKMGCFLGEINRLAYRERPQVAAEVMLIWYLVL